MRKRQGAERARPIGADHFAGAGGMSLGSEQAGFDAVAAVKIDPIHAAVNKFKVPDCEVFARSVTDLTSDEIRKLAGVGNRVVDVMFGGAPCQCFAMVGQRALDESYPRRSCIASATMRSASGTGAGESCRR